VKHLLYAYRVLLTGIHLLQTGEVIANIQVPNQRFRLTEIDELSTTQIDILSVTQIKSLSTIALPGVYSVIVPLPSVVVVVVVVSETCPHANGATTANAMLKSTFLIVFSLSCLVAVAVSFPCTG